MALGTGGGAGSEGAEGVDVAFAPLMVPSPHRMLETLGRHALGLEASVVNDPGMTNDSADQPGG
jgi:hypothetical protein